MLNDDSYNENTKYRHPPSLPPAHSRHHRSPPPPITRHPPPPPPPACTEQVLLTKGSIGAAPSAEETGKNTNTGFVTFAEVESLIKEKAISFSPTIPVLDTRPPYPLKLASLPYPEGYCNIHFARYDGKRGNSKEHVARFLDNLGIYREDEALRMREFSKSLTDRAYTWYANLEPGSITSWAQMASMFHAKFFSVEEKVTTVSLSREVQGDNENLVKYVDRFRDRAMECHDNTSEENLVQLCIHGMLRDYRIHLINLSLPAFSDLMVAARNLAKDIRISPRSHREPRFSGPSRRYPTAAVTEERKDREKERNDKRRRDEDDASAPFPCSMGEVLAVLRRWLRDGVVTPRPPTRAPTEADKGRNNYCAYHQFVKHATKDCWAL